jgi:hypothetical protein
MATRSPRKGRILAIFFRKRGNFARNLRQCRHFRKNEKPGTTISGHVGLHGPGFCLAPRDDWRGRAANREERERERERVCGRDQVRVAASRIGCNLRDKSFVRCGRPLVQMTQEIRAFNELSEDIFLITLSSRFAWYCRVFQQTE